MVKEDNVKRIEHILSQWKIKSTGGSFKIRDIIFFIQKTQSYA